MKLLLHLQPYHLRQHNCVLPNTDLYPTRLDGYGQAGFVSGQGGGPFADVAVQAHRSIPQSQRASFAIGAGIWGGGQDNVMRIDIGPNMRANVRAGSALFQLDASWRVRVAGHAQPGNGPAMTLSTSF